MPSKIEWTEHTWNPFVGCEIVSAGCKNCYAMRMAGRLQAMGRAAYEGTTAPSKAGRVWTGRLNRSSDATMRKPFTIRDPSMIFVNSMSDFWNPAADDLWRLEALWIMRECEQHVFQVLTKRPQEIEPALVRLGEDLPVNVWLGTTVEDHRVVDRIDMLRAVQHEGVKFLSVEPMTARLGPVDLSGIDWVILGGESGPRARPMEVAWAREVRDQCAAQGVPLFFKQFGRPENNPRFPDVDKHGKGGAMLDGRLWRQWPEDRRIARAA